MASGYDNERYSLRTDAALGQLPTAHLTTTTFNGGGAWSGCAQMLNKEGDSATEQKKYIYQSGILSTSTLYFFRGCSFVSPQLPKGYASEDDKRWSYQHIVTAFSPPAGISLFLAVAAFIVDGEGNKKYTIDDADLIYLAGGVTKTTYTGTISYTAANYDIAWGDRLVYEIFSAIYNYSGSPVGLSKARYTLHMGQTQASGSDFAIRFDPIYNVPKKTFRTRVRR